MAERKLGAALRVARRERNLTLAEVSNRLHIKAGFLDAIERGESDAYFPRSYLTGYARSYGQLLRVDLAAELDALAAELRRAREESVPAFDPPMPKSGLRSAHGWFLAGGVALAGILLYGMSMEAPPADLASDDPPVVAVRTPPQPPAIEPAAAEKAAPAVPAPETRMQPLPASLDTTSDARPPERTKLVTTPVYLRARPSNEAAPVATIMRCTRVGIGDALKSGWVEVTHGDDAGYLYRTFLKDTMPSCGGGEQASR